MIIKARNGAISAFTLIRVVLSHNGRALGTLTDRLHEACLIAMKKPYPVLITTVHTYITAVSNLFMAKYPFEIQQLAAYPQNF